MTAVVCFGADCSGKGLALGIITDMTTDTRVSRLAAEPTLLTGGRLESAALDVNHGLDVGALNHNQCMRHLESRTILMVGESNGGFSGCHGDANVGGL